MICEYPILGQPVRIDTNLSKHKLEELVRRHCPADLRDKRPREKRNNFNGHLICWYRVMRDRKRVYAVDILAYDLRMNRLIRHPLSDECRDYNAACTVVRNAVTSATPVR